MPASLQNRTALCKHHAQTGRGRLGERERAIIPPGGGAVKIPRAGAWNVPSLPRPTLILEDIKTVILEPNKNSEGEGVVQH